MKSKYADITRPQRFLTLEYEVVRVFEQNNALKAYFHELSEKHPTTANDIILCGFKDPVFFYSTIIS